VKTFLTIVITFLALSSCRDEYINKELYLFTRSTRLKQGFIAEDFNITDSLSTHIGIGYKNDDDFVIYHVSNERVINHSSLMSETLKEFIAIEDVHYYSIWKCDITQSEYDFLFSELLSLSKERINFDHDLVLDNEDLYCSEFVYSILELVNREKFFYKPIKKPLTLFYISILKRDNLEYIPVDFFTENKMFEKIEENFM
jgi:hypothetical protein